MHPHLTEVVSEAQLEDGSCFQIERLAGRAEHSMNDGRNFGRFHRVNSFALQTILLARFTLAG
jgi:hypothetical protein